jgi:hypothetical protein
MSTLSLHAPHRLQTGRLQLFARLIASLAAALDASDDVLRQALAAREKYPFAD